MDTLAGVGRMGEGGYAPIHAKDLLTVVWINSFLGKAFYDALSVISTHIPYHSLKLSLNA